MLMNRKTATKLLLVQWSRFQNECIRLEGSTLFTGVNGTGKTTILDAMTYLLTGNTQFNKAAKDRDRTVAAYVRGDTKSNGAERYLRNGEIVSYIVMEFWSPVENNYMVIGVCIESANDLSYKSSWFICRNASMEQKDFAVVENIRFYREEYRNIANIKMEEAHNRLEEQGKKLESAFMNDFVAEINETVREARGEIEIINRELKKIPFGNDTYKFVMREKADRSVFFRICRKLEQYMDSPEVYMNSARDDEEMEHDIQEFMSVILDEEDEREYTDYRKYFVYDMEIVSRQGGQEFVADLSKKQGSASNGEKQTPYFIILAASLIQYYPRQVCCARLAFIDEAFSALSRERIEQMVKYFEENHFQVFYAAPPEKINSIGSFIDSTVSLVTSGRYTHAVEGLVRENGDVQ